MFLIFFHKTLKMNIFLCKKIGCLSPFVGQQLLIIYKINLQKVNFLGCPVPFPKDPRKELFPPHVFD